jgi:hypothetical protein
MTTADPIKAIENAAHDVAEARDRLDLAAAIAAERGHSFGEIGAAAGISRQAARQRWTDEARAAILAKASASRITITYTDGHVERFTSTDPDEIRRLENLVFTDPDSVVHTRVDVPAQPAAELEEP